MNLNRRQLIQGLGLAGIAGCLGGCQSAPLTGRRQLMLLPENQELELGIKAYDRVFSREDESSNLPLIQLVHRVGQRIAKIADRRDFAWEFRLINSSQQNAFCLPGGKVAVYEGILPVCENEAGLAVVMSHEIAHALARHGGERMSQSLVSSGTKEILGRVAKKKVPDKADRLMQAYGVVSEYGVLLPYSRQQESEADHIGVMLMAQAGYDPNEAPRFWQRFGMTAGQKPPEFLSTHPSDKRRAVDLIALMGEAEQYYATAPQKLGRGQPITRRATPQDI